jgi:hypothetical protein
MSNAKQLPFKPEERPVIKLDEKIYVDPAGLKRNVLNMVTGESYSQAINELVEFINSKSEYPHFREKAERYVRHSIELIHAIEAKKNFPGVQSLTRSKAQELSEKTADHYHELQDVLGRIEQIRTGLQMGDARSTVWVLRALTHSAWIILLSLFILDIKMGLFETANIVLDEVLDKLLSLIF